MITRLMMQVAYRGYCPKRDYHQLREDYISHSIDITSGRRELRMSINKFKRTFKVIFFRTLNKGIKK